MCKSVFFPTAAPPNLTVDGVMRVVEGVRNWRELGSELCIPHSKRGKQVKDVITYWFASDPFVCWRRLIHALDESGENLKGSQTLFVTMLNHWQVHSLKYPTDNTTCTHFFIYFHKFNI